LSESSTLCAFFSPRARAKMSGAYAVGEGCALLVYSEAKRQHSLIVRPAFGCVTVYDAP
jgi:hypothetical protein